MSRNARLSLIVVALILAVSALVLRASGINPTNRWWEIALAGIAAAAMVYLLIAEARGKR